MALYYYEGFQKDGRKVSGTFDVASQAEIRHMLARRGIYPTVIKSTTAATAQPWYNRLLPTGISLKDKVFFTKQLAVLLKSGVPLLQALELLVEQTDGALKRIVIHLKDNIKEGQSLASGLTQFPQTFDAIYVQLVKAGEATGKLDMILERLTGFLEEQQAVRGKIRSALAYPAAQLLIIVAIVIGLLTFVVPEISKVFKDQGIELPLSTRILVGASQFLTSYYLLLLILLGFFTAAFMLWKSTERGAILWDKFLLRLPIIGHFTRMGAVVQFCRTLGMLLQGGVNFAEALTIVSKIVDNRILKRALDEAKEKIIKQGKIAYYLKETALFPPVAIYLIKTGEESGELSQMLLAVAENFEAELKEYADTLTTLLQPIMMTVMGVVVGFVIMSIMGPMQKIQQQAEKQMEKLK